METLRNSFGKPVKRKTWIITRSDPLSPRPYCQYLGKSGIGSCYSADHAAKFLSYKAAHQEMECFATLYPRFVWRVELA